MLRIRLSRTGLKKQPHYRIVVANVEAKRDGRVVERIGHYNPRREPIDFRIDEDRALYWLSVGAQPSDPVKRLLVKQGTIDRLARLREGASLDALVAEFSGAAAPAAGLDETAAGPPAAVAEAAAEVVAEMSAETKVIEVEAEIVAEVVAALEGTAASEEEE